MRRVIILGNDSDELLVAIRATAAHQVEYRSSVAPSLTAIEDVKFDLKRAIDRAADDDVCSTNQSPGHGSYTTARRAMVPSVKRLAPKPARKKTPADLSIPAVKAAEARRADRASKRLAAVQKQGE